MHSNCPSNTNLGKIDPVVFLFIYLLQLPLLHMSLGGWLLAPEDSATVVETLDGSRMMRC